MSSPPTIEGAHDPYAAASDRILPFSVDALDARGRVVKLGASIDAVIGRHAYPEPVSRLLAEASALTVLLGASLKIEGLPGRLKDITWVD